MIVDAAKVKGIAPLTAKTDKIDARVLAELARRDLVPEIWLPTVEVRAERERARFRPHFVHHRAWTSDRASTWATASTSIATHLVTPCSSLTDHSGLG